MLTGLRLLLAKIILFSSGMFACIRRHNKGHGGVLYCVYGKSVVEGKEDNSLFGFPPPSEFSLHLYLNLIPLPVAESGHLPFNAMFQTRKQNCIIFFSSP